jgi:predicted ABC-type transport system involved in lysophospholipase L1 biosynthesis ATPase subunit
MPAAIAAREDLAWTDKQRQARAVVEYLAALDEVAEPNPDRTRPELIVADEPTSALDRHHQAAFLDLLFTEVKEAGATLVMVSHDESLAERFDRVMRLDEVVASRRKGEP